MSGAITVSRAGERLIACKRADGSRTHRLNHEAEVLQRISHPGVIQFIGLTPTDSGAVLETVFVGPQNWTSDRPANSSDAAAGAASLLATVADLHETGITHNAITSDHVVVAPDGRPVLCSFGAAQIDPHSAVGTPAANPDLEQMGLLLDSLATNDRDPVALGLGLIADDLRSGSLDARQAARRCDRLARDPETDPPLTGRPRTALWSAAIAILVVVGGLVGRQLMTGAPNEPDGADAAPRSTTQTTASTIPVVTTPTPSTTSPSASTRPAIEHVDAAPGSDQTGLIIDHGGRRYAIGTQGDIARLGDWDCDGVETPAVLRPATGEIIVFADWPEPGQSVTATASWAISGATDIRLDEQSDCDRIRVVTASGSQLIDPGEKA